MVSAAEIVPFSRDFVDFVDERPIPVGTVVVDGAGHLDRLTSRGDVEFTFEYLGFRFAIRAETDDRDGHMTIDAVLGTLPYTAEGSYARVNAWAIVAAAESALDRRLHMTGDQRIVFADEMHFDEALTPATLLAATARSLIQAKPFLELLTAVVEPPQFEPE